MGQSNLYLLVHVVAEDINTINYHQQGSSRLLMVRTKETDWYHDQIDADPPSFVMTSVIPLCVITRERSQGGLFSQAPKYWTF